MSLLETDLIEQCKKGERKAQMHFYSEYYKRVYNSCFRILRNEEEAEDAMQDAFIKIFSNLEKYDGIVPVGAWITRIAVNTAIDKFRRNKNDLLFSDDIQYDIIDNDEEGYWDDLTLKIEKIKSAINRLPEASRIIITLYLIEGYDHEEIAGILDIKKGTVRIQYMRAKQKLIELLK